MDLGGVPAIPKPQKENPRFCRPLRRHSGRYLNVCEYSLNIAKNIS